MEIISFPVIITNLNEDLFPIVLLDGSHKFLQKISIFLIQCQVEEYTLAFQAKKIVTSRIRMRIRKVEWNLAGSPSLLQSNVEIIF